MNKLMNVLGVIFGFAIVILFLVVVVVGLFAILAWLLSGI